MLLKLPRYQNCEYWTMTTHETQTLFSAVEVDQVATREVFEGYVAFLRNKTGNTKIRKQIQV